MTKDMTDGSPVRLIIGFAVPMFLGMLFQQFYSMVDTIIVGQYLGVNPLAGVGSTTSLNFMVIGFCTGVCNGFAIPVAQMFGAKDEKGLRRFVTNGAWLCAVFALVVTVLVVSACRTVLRLMNTPAEIFDYAWLYIVIIFCGIPCTFLYNLLAAIIRALGDSKTPVMFLAFSSVLNIVLDFVSIRWLHMSVEGPALATVLSQGVSGAVCLLYMRKKFPILRTVREDWKPEGSCMVKLCVIGIPMGLQYSVTAIGALVLQTAINGMGAAVVAGVAAAQKINAFIASPVEALGQTMAPYTGQNIGAGKLDRIGKGLLQTSLVGFGVSICCFLIALLTGKYLVLLFLDAKEAQIIAYACRFLLCCTGGFCLLTLVNAVRFTIQGMGFSVFAIISGVMEMIARILVAVLSARYFGFAGICLAHPTAWLFADLFLIPAFFYCRRRVAASLR
ncbi:MAG: MATE family efflux transporter [Lachnospiraceae bacterium]